MRKAKPRNTVNPPDSEYETTPVQVLFSGWVYSRRGKEAMRKAQPRSQGLFPGFVANASSPDNNGDY